MIKSTYRDLLVIIGLSIISTIYLIIPSLNYYPVNLIPYLLLLLFLPGYSLLTTIDPTFNSKSNTKKLFLSIGVSLLISVFLWLISNYTPVKIFNFIFLIAITIILSLLAIIRRRLFFKRRTSLKADKKPPVNEGITDDKEKSEFEKHELISKDTSRNKLPEDEPIYRKKYFFMDLIVVLILTALCVLFVLEPALNKTAIRSILGLLLVLFLPGYALIALLFPKKDDLDTIERLALSFGLSIAITPLVGLILNYTPYGIRLDPILVSLTGVTVVLCLFAFLRRRRIPEDNRFLVDFGGFFMGITEIFQGESKTGKILSVILIICIILAIFSTVYIIIKPKEGENFTEFYILGPNGKASDYPTNLTTNQEGKVIIGIVNHENNQTSYRLVVTSNNSVVLEQTVKLENGEKIEIPFNFTAGDPGDKKMEFLLYKLPDTNNIYRSLHLWINITSS